MADFFDRAEILSVLHGFNPWWGDRPASAPSFRRIAYQQCRKYLDDEALHRAILLSGPRRVGKTTILTQIAESLVADGRPRLSILYLSFDHPMLKLLTLPEVLRLYHESVYPEGERAVLLLDEIQYAKEWELEIKQLIDHKRFYRVLATGSASVVHKQRLAESGVGRWVKVSIPTLSFYEFLLIRKEELPQVPDTLRPADLFTKSDAELVQLGTKFRKLMPFFVRYLLVGGFPETAQHPDIAVCQRLLREDVVERVLKRDMTALFGIRNVNDLEKLFIYLCLHTGGIFKVQTCASALGISHITVGNHIDALEQANLIYRLPPAAVGGKAVLKARHKIYLVDAALRNAVLLKGDEITQNPQEMGIIVETTVLRHLAAYYYRDMPQIMYWREQKTGEEVDIIVKSPAYTLPVEVKYREDASIGEGDGIVTFCEDESISKAYVVTQRERDFGITHMNGRKTKILRVPAHIFTYLLGQAERLLWS